MAASSVRFLATALVVTAAFIPVRAQAQDGYADSRNADLDAKGARSARVIAGAGTLRIEGRSGLTQVRVRGVARSPQRNRLADIKLVAERRGDVVFIKAEIPDDNREGWRLFDGGYQNMALDLVIEVPNALALDVEDGSGEARFINTGALMLVDGSGEVEIRGTRGDVDVTDGSGGLIIDGVEGTVRVDDGSGEIRGSNVTGDFIVKEDGSGDINVYGVGGTMTVRTDGSGSIDVDRVAGDFVVDDDGAGRIRYNTVKGRVSIPDRKRRG